MTTGEKIARLRKGNSLSQEQLAEMLGISRQTVSKWENGTAVPTRENLSRIADSFGVQVSTLYSTDVEKSFPAKDSMAMGPENEERKETAGTLVKNLFFLAVLGFMFFIHYDMYFKIEALEDLSARQSEELSKLYSYIDLMHTPQRPRTDRFTRYEYSVSDYDRDTGMITLDISIVPADYSSTTLARFSAVTSQGTHSADAVLTDHSFEAQLRLYRQEDTPLYLYLTDGRQVRSYLVDYLPDLARDYRISIMYANIVGTDVMVKENGRLDLRNGRIDLTYDYTVSSTNENMSVYPQIAVLEIYADGWLIDQRAIEQVTDTDYYSLSTQQPDYIAGEAYRGRAHAYHKLNDKGMGGYTVIENEHIKENSEITFRIVMVDNHGVRYEKDINY